jgi:polysaccharide export outer membrane protein
MRNLSNRSGNASAFLKFFEDGQAGRIMKIYKQKTHVSLPRPGQPPGWNWRHWLRICLRFRCIYIEFIEMKGRPLRLVLIIFAATATAEAAIFTNSSDLSWPTVPLSPSTTSIPTLPPTDLPSVPTPVSEEPTNIATNSIRSAENSAAKATNSTTGGDYSLDDNHQLEPGDNISFQILEDRYDTYNNNNDKPPLNLTVTDSSEVDLPYLGRVSVAGKTCKQLAADLKVALEKDYYYHATVIVGLNSINQVRGQAFVSGMVRAQGSVDILFNRDLTAGEAILRMGGLDDFADKKQVKVIRNRGAGTNEEIMVVNMEDVLDKGEIDKDVVLQPGDFIIVPARMLNF